MNLHRQLVRAIVALLLSAGFAAAERLLPSATQCPLADSPPTQRILLLDPTQKHPMWIDARFDAHGTGMQRFDRMSEPAPPSRDTALPMRAGPCMA